MVTAVGGGGEPNLQCRAEHKAQRGERRPGEHSHRDAAHSGVAAWRHMGQAGCRTEKEEKMGQDE